MEIIKRDIVIDLSSAVEADRAIHRLSTGRPCHISQPLNRIRSKTTPKTSKRNGENCQKEFPTEAPKIANETRLNYQVFQQAVSFNAKICVLILAKKYRSRDAPE